MIVPEIKRIYADDVDLRAYDPDPTVPFSVNIVMDVGAVGHAGADIFYLRVSNLLDLAEDVRLNGTWVARHTVIVETFNFEAIRESLKKAVARCTGVTWPDVVLKLSAIGEWEFTGMYTLDFKDPNLRS